RKNIELHRRPGGLQHHLMDRYTGAHHGVPEIAGGEVPQPCEVLYVPGLIESPLLQDAVVVFLSQLRRALAEHRVDWASRRSLEYPKRRDRHQEHDDDALEQPLNDIAIHGATLHVLAWAGSVLRTRSLPGSRSG